MSHRLLESSASDSVAYSSALASGPENLEFVGSARNITAVASALRDIRECMAESDCMAFPEEDRRRITARGRELAEAIGGHVFGGMVVSGDPDEKLLELTADSVDATRRLVIRLRQDGHYQTTRIDDAGVVRSGWSRKIYNMSQHAEWLLNVDPRP